MYSKIFLPLQLIPKRMRVILNAVRYFKWQSRRAVNDDIYSCCQLNNFSNFFLVSHPDNRNKLL